MIFFFEVPFWFGYIWNTLAFYLAIALLIRAECVQSIVYREVYGNVRTYATAKQIIQIDIELGTLT